MDWIDIVEHVVPSLALVIGAWFLGLWVFAFALLLVWGFWPVREWLQTPEKYGRFLAPWEWSLQKHAEAWLPGIFCTLAAVSIYGIYV